MKRTLKILALILTFIVALPLALAGCGDGRDYYEDEHGNRIAISKIKFLHIWPEHNAALTKIVNDFMAANPAIRVETQTTSYGDIQTYLNSQLLSGSLPDVFFYWSKQVKGYIDSDVLLDLSPYTDDWKNTYINNGEAWEWAHRNGGYYSAPFRVTGNIIVYNKSLFADCGLTAPADIVAFEDALKRVRNLSASNSFAPLAVTGVAGGTLVQLYTAFQNFVGLQQEGYLDPNYKTGRLETNDEILANEAKMLTKLRDWYRKYYFGYCDGKTESTAIRNFVEGNAAMVLMNNNNLYLLDDIGDDFEVGFMSIPAPSDVDYTYIYSDFDGFSIAKNTRYKEASVKFLKYLTGKAVQQSFADTEGSIMTLSDIVYKNADQQSMAVALKDAGDARLAYTDAEFSTGDYDNKNAESVLNFIMDKSAASASKVVQDIYSNNVKAMRDAGLSPLAWTVAPKTADLSWLDLRT